MDLEPTPDQEALRDETRRFLADRVTSEARRAMQGLPGAVCCEQRMCPPSITQARLQESGRLDPSLP